MEKDQKLFKIDLYKMRIFFSREKIVKKLFYPMMNSRFEILGCKMGWNAGKTLEFKRTRRFRFQNECVLANYAFHNNKISVLEVEAQLN